MPPKARMPDCITNKAIGDLVSAFLIDAATDYGKKAEENGTSSLAGATTRLVSAAAGQLRSFHKLDEPETADDDESQTDEYGSGE